MVFLTRRTTGLNGTPAQIGRSSRRPLYFQLRTFVIERPDKSVESVSRSRVVLAPENRTFKKIQRAIRPLMDEYMNPGDYPAITTASYDTPNELTTNRINLDIAKASRGGIEYIIIEAVEQDETVKHDSKPTED